MHCSRGSSWPKDQTHISCVSCIVAGFFTHWAMWEALNNTRVIQEKAENEWKEHRTDGTRATIEKKKYFF